jgi:hypothetical protein
VDLLHAVTLDADVRHRLHAVGQQARDLVG